MSVENRKKLLAGGPVWEYLGIDLIKMAEGKSEVHLPTKKEFTQLHGNVHGGIIATLIDATMAAAMNSLLDEDEFTVTTEMKINYLSPANGPLMIGRGNVIKRGRTLSLCQAEMTDEQGKLLAHATATFYVFKK